jgi:HEAT repeat protein
MRSTFAMNNAVRVVTTGQGASVAPASAGGGQQATSEAEKQSQASAVSALNTIYEKAADLDIKRQALSSLANTGEAGIDRLIDVAKNEKNVELRRSAVSYLSRTKDPRALQLLQDIVNK